MATTILWKKNQVSKGFNKGGFTFIEMLLSLFFFAMIIFSIQSVTQNYIQIQASFNQSKLPEWQQFLLLLEKELDRLRIISVTEDEIQVEDPQSNKIYQIVLKNNKIYRESGHHPYMYYVQDWYVYLEGEVLFIELLTLDGEFFQGVISDVLP